MVGPSLGPNARDSAPEGRSRGCVDTTPARLGDAASRYTVPWGWIDVVGAAALSIVFSGMAGFAVTLARPVLGDLYAAPILVCASALAVAAAVMGWTRARRADWSESVFGRHRPTRRDLVMAIAAGLGMFAVITVGLGWLLGVVVGAGGGELPRVQQDLQGFADDPRTAPLLALGAVVLAPIGEEMFFRGLLFPVLRRRFAAWPAIMLSAAVFAGIHVQSTLDAYAVTALIVLPVGMTLAWLRERRATLWVPIVAHSVYNLVQVVLLVMKARA